MKHCRPLLQGVSIFVLWVCCAYPFWGYLIGGVEISPLVFGPFIINIISLIGNESFESLALDWRVLSINYLSSGIFALASLLSDEYDHTTAAIIGIASLVSLIGSIGRIQINHKFILQLERRFSSLKVGILVGLSLAVAWAGISYTLAFSKLNFGTALVIHLLFGTVVIVGCILSLLFPHGVRKGQVGVGSPLLWIAARLLMSGAGSGFWIWFVFSIFCFCVMQFGRDQRIWPSFWVFVEAIQLIEVKYLGMTLSLAVYQLLITLKAPLNRVCSQPEEVYFSQLHAYDIVRTTFVNGPSSQCGDFENEWRALAYLNASTYLKQPAIFWHQLVGEELCISHFMYDQSGSIIVIILLLASSLMYSLRRIKSVGGDQGFWQPVFFVSAAIIVTLYSREKNEIISAKSGVLSVTWSMEAITFVCISIYGAIISGFFSLYRLKSGKLIRLATDVDVGQIKNSKPLVIETSLAFLLIALTIGVIVLGQLGVLGKGSYGEILTQGGSNFSFSDEYEFLSLFNPRILSVGKFLNDSDCSSIIDCKEVIRQWEGVNSSCTTGISMTLLKFFFAYPDEVIDFQVGLFSLLRTEMVIIQVLLSITLFMLIFSISIPELEDISLALCLLGVAILCVAIPFKLNELSYFQPREVVALSSEWEITFICIAVIVASGLLFHVRVRRTISYLLPFHSSSELREAFEACLDDREFLHKHFPGERIKGKTWDDLFNGMKDRILRENMLTRAQECLPSYCELVAVTKVAEEEKNTENELLG